MEHQEASVMRGPGAYLEASVMRGPRAYRVCVRVLDASFLPVHSTHNRPPCSRPVCNAPLRSP